MGARGGLTAGVAAGTVHVTGGEALGSGAVYDDHWSLRDEAAGWRSREPLPTGRHGLASVGVGDRWLVIGGATRAGAQTVLSAVAHVNVWAEDPQDGG